MNSRDFLLYRILCGYLKFGDLKIVAPTPDILYEATGIYYKTIKSAEELGIMDDAELLKTMIAHELWTEKEEKELTEILVGHIEYWKKEIYLNWWKPKDRERVQKYLQVAKDTYEELFSRRYAYNYVTQDGIAAYAKYQYIIENCTYLGDKKFDWESQSPYSTMLYYQSNIIKEEYLRDLSHNAPWETIWLAGKKEQSLFGKPAVELSFDQLRLISWSTMYDNIREHYETPPDEIVQNDDALDGWLIIQKEEKEQKQFEKRADGQVQNQKIKNANEIYLMANLEDDLSTVKSNVVDTANKIDAMNSAYSKMLKKQRYKLIDRQGQINEQALPDVKQDFMMQLTQAHAQKMKG
jgi:hypothetical protein